MKKLFISLFVAVATAVAVYAVSVTQGAKPVSCSPECADCGCTESCCGK